MTDGNKKKLHICPIFANFVTHEKNLDMSLGFLGGGGDLELMQNIYLNSINELKHATTKVNLIS